MSSLEKYKIVKSDEKNENGICRKVMGFVEGQKVMIKTFVDGPKESLAEYFAYKLGSALGFNVNKVKIIDCGELLGLKKVCSVHWWEDKFIPAREYPKHESEYDQAIKIFFDALISNEDRNLGNYGFIEDTDKLFLIDNGFSYPWSPFCEEDKRNLIRYGKSLKEFANKFLTFNENDFRHLLEVPDEIKECYDLALFDNIVERMKQAQNILKEAIQ